MLGGLRPWAMELLRSKQLVIIGKGKGRHAARMVAFKQRAEEVAAMEVERAVAGQERERLIQELCEMVRGSFRPTLIPHPLMRIHGRVWMRTIKPGADQVLGGIGYGACITGGADNPVSLARLCVDSGGVYSAHDVQSGYPMGHLQTRWSYAHG